MAQWMQRTLAASASVTTVAVLVPMVGVGRLVTPGTAEIRAVEDAVPGTVG